MTPQEFASKIYSHVVLENNKIYQDLFGSTIISEASDLYWGRALTLFRGLNYSEREVFFEVMRQVSVDTVANVFGIIDGVNRVDGIDGVVNLIVDDVDVSGDLQNLFLVEDERARGEIGPE
ncbi:hypothetical protein H9L17_14270 [Thermomonas brevis]|uniref:Uncharacterized protein n=1 Tax=Thermomonas brevis TaxID=215691 RepID=A0A7G9QSJ0_9GAMM|nr:hypothetical protein [Thermomonas brevis]QNN46315.1 hypothetical protein H9L17_14270 [Thermomonas brevis]